ncbi:hypothetical protein [Cupriavidus sp. UYPR2.512]
MIRAGSATHAFSSNQRFIGLTTRQIGIGLHAGMTPERMDA